MCILWDFDFIPVDEPSVEPRTLNFRDDLDITLEKSPLLSQQEIIYENTQIVERVAGNQRLPQLDIFGSAGVTGLEDSNHSACTIQYIKSKVGY